MTATVEPTTTTTISISRQALRSALGKLLAGVDTSSKAMPVAQHVLVEASENRLTMTATNFDAFVRLSVPCECDGEGTALLPAKLLSEIVAALPPAPVRLTLDAPNAVIEAGRSRFELTGLAPDEFPAFDESAGTTLELPAAQFLDALTRCATHTSDAPSRPALNGVFVEIDDTATPRLLIVGCDGHSIVRLSGGAVPAGTTLPSGCLVSRFSVPLLSRLFGDLAEDATIRLTLDGARLQVASEEAVAHVRLIDQQYPNYRQTIPQSATHIAVCDRLLFASALKRVALATGESGRVSIELTDEMAITAPKGERGSATDVVPLETHAHPDRDDAITFDVNAALLGRSLAALADDRVALVLDRPERAIVLRGAYQPEADPTVALVMPLRRL